MWNAYDNISGPINYRASDLIQDKITYCNDTGPREIPKQECKDDFKTFHTRGLCRRGITTCDIFFMYMGPSYSRTLTGIMKATANYKFRITWYCVALKPRPLGSGRRVTRSDHISSHHGHCVPPSSWQVNPLPRTGMLMRQSSPCPLSLEISVKQYFEARSVKCHCLKQWWYIFNYQMYSRKNKTFLVLANTKFRPHDVGYFAMSPQSLYPLRNPKNILWRSK